MSKSPTLTTTAGAPIADNQNSVSAGPRGPLLMQDYQLLEKLAHQNRERIPERVVHAKGSAAYGTLTITQDITQYSKARVFAKIGKRTECLLRFSTVAGERGAADAVSLQVDAGHHELDQPRGRSSRRQEPRERASGSLRRHRNPRFSQVAGLPADHAGDGCGDDAVQPVHITKVWPHKDYPLIEVGVLELNRNPENYFAEVEQASFSPSNIVPGISWSPDKMLQARIFSYADAHRYRVGTHYEMLPVNRPKCPVQHYHLDGAMRFDAPNGPDAFYEPSSFAGPVQDPGFREPPLKISGDADRWDHRAGNDDYTQPGNLFRLMTQMQKDALMDNIAEAMQGVPSEIVKRQVGHFYRADPNYGIGVATRMGLAAGDLPAAVAAE